MLTPHVKRKIGDWENQGWFCFCFLAAISFSYGRTLGSKVRVSLKLNPMFLFLKSKFGSRKKATGKDVDFHAVFCGQFSISLHSSVQNWSLLLWLLFCLAMEVLDGRSQIMTCFWLLADFFLFAFFSFWWKCPLVWRLPSCDSLCLHHMQTPKCVRVGELPVGLVMGWGQMKR